MNEIEVEPKAIDFLPSREMLSIGVHDADWALGPVWLSADGLRFDMRLTGRGFAGSSPVLQLSRGDLSPPLHQIRRALRASSVVVVGGLKRPG